MSNQSSDNSANIDFCKCFLFDAFVVSQDSIHVVCFSVLLSHNDHLEAQISSMMLMTYTPLTCSIVLFTFQNVCAIVNTDQYSSYD